MGDFLSDFQVVLSFQGRTQTFLDLLELSQSAMVLFPKRRRRAFQAIWSGSNHSDISLSLEGGVDKQDFTIVL